MMKNVKKIISILLSVIVAVSLACLVGCDLDLGEMFGVGALGGDSVVFPSDGVSGDSSMIEQSPDSGEKDGSSQSGDNGCDQQGESDLITVRFACGNGSDDIVLKGSAGDPITMPADPARTGYEFGGWECGGESITLEVFPESDMTLTAVWHKIIRVVFRFGNGEDDTVIRGKAGDPLSVPADPTREGYEFGGWECGGELVEIGDQSVIPDSNAIFDAVWHRIIKITFVFGNGKSNEVVEVKAGDSVTKPEDPTRAGYEFGGWERGGESVSPEVFPEADMTLTAVWHKLIKVTFDPANGKQATVVRGKTGDLIIAPEDPTREGYLFGGWECGGEAFTVFIFPENDVTLTAKWARTATVHFDTGTSDVVVEDQILEYGETVTEPVVERAGFMLCRWTYRGAPFDFDSVVSSDITLTAEWLERTNLPTMSIELFKDDGSTFNITSITRETYVNSTITLCDEEGNLELDNYVSQTKGRGNGSWTEVSGGRGKCGLKLKLDKKESLFGRTKNKHWVLLACVNFEDATMSRNYTAFNMAGELFDGIEYTTNVVWVDLYVNGEYRGVYDLCEHVRVGNGRVDIESEYGVLDTGYLIEYDAYAPDGGTKKGIDYFSINESDGVINNGGSRSDLVKYGFTMQSPSPEDYATEGNITEEQYREQVSFIQDYVKRTYSSIIKDKNFTAFSELADADSFVDMYILQELYKNKDCGFSSFFLYKKPGGKLYAGPAWDFDGSTNAESRSADGIFIADGSRNSYSYWNGSSELFVSLYANAQFKALVVDRWKTLSPQISEYYNDLFTEEFYSTYGDAMAKNFCRWKSGASVSSERTNWISKTETLFTWFKNRISWLNNEWK